MSRSIVQLPPEVVIEIFKFSIDDLQFISTLSQICKNWKILLEDDEFGFYKYLYYSYFSWRNNTLQNLNSNSFKILFTNEIKFWNNWNFNNYLTEFKTSHNKQLLQIKRLNTGDFRNYITQPLFYNTGSYYFEIKSLKDHKRSDNVLVGFLLKEEQKEPIDINTYLGSSNSFGLFFSTGGILGFKGNNNYVSFGHVETNTTVGVYLDTNNLKVRFVLLLNKQKFSRMFSLDEFFRMDKLEDYCNGKLALHPAISLLYADDILELNTSVGFQSIKKANWIKDVLSKE